MGEIPWAALLPAWALTILGILVVLKEPLTKFFPGLFSFLTSKQEIKNAEEIEALRAVIASQKELSKLTTILVNHIIENEQQHGVALHHKFEKSFTRLEDKVDDVIKDLEILITVHSMAIADLKE